MTPLSDKIERLLKNFGVDRSVDIYVHKHAPHHYCVGLSYIKQWCRYLFVVDCWLFSLEIIIYCQPWTKDEFRCKAPK
jgi:hypothetical protein